MYQALSLYESLNFLKPVLHSKNNPIKMFKFIITLILAQVLLAAPSPQEEADENSQNNNEKLSPFHIEFPSTSSIYETTGNRPGRK